MQCLVISRKGRRGPGEAKSGDPAAQTKPAWAQTGCADAAGLIQGPERIRVRLAKRLLEQARLLCHSRRQEERVASLNSLSVRASAVPVKLPSPAGTAASAAAPLPR